MLFARNLETIRTENNLSIPEFADYLDISETTLRRASKRTRGSDQYNPSLSTVRKAARALKIDIETLITRRVTSIPERQAVTE